MSTETQPQHPQAAEALEHLKRFNSLLENSMSKSDTGSFTATDEDETVTATINGHRVLTGLFVEEGLLRQGAEVVEQRINEAIGGAQLRATEALAAQQQEMLGELFEVTANLAKSVGLFED